MTAILSTPLESWHINNGAKMCPFSGWNMPIQYKLGILKEHEFVRSHAGLFDVCHMGEITVQGSQAFEFLNYLCTNDLSKIQDGQCQYTLMCYENGTVVDDLIINQKSKTDYLLVVNASNIQKDFDWMQKQVQNFDVSLVNISDQKGLIALQGPKALSIAQKVFGEPVLSIDRFHHITLEWQNKPVFISRTGYTGEDGFEIMCDADQSNILWESLIQAGGDELRPIGLGARDTLRLEACYSLYGHEINDQINPLEAGLSWVVSLGKSNFIGKESLVTLKEQGIKRQLIGFEMVDPGIARDHALIYSGDQKVGEVTSGSYLPTLKKSMGLALIQKEFVNAELFADIRGKMKRIQKVKKPFFKLT